MASIERTAYPRFKKILSGRELNEFYTPSEEEAMFGRSTVRGDVNLLCFVVLLKTFQRFSYFPPLREIPLSVVKHIRGCLGLPASTEPVYDHPRTLYRHRHAIRQYLAIRPNSEKQVRRLIVRSVYESALVMDSPSDLINVAVETLLRNRCELPGFPTLDRAVRRVRALVHRRFFQRVLGRMSETEMQSVDQLLSNEMGGKTAFNEVKRLPKRPTLEHFERLLNHLEWLDALGSVERYLADIPPAIVRHFAREAKALDAAELKDFTAPKQYTLLICLVHRMRIQARDDLAEMFLKRMGKIHKNAQEALQDLQARQRRMTEGLVATLDGVLSVVTAATSAQDTLNDIRDLFAMNGGTEKLRDDCAAIAAWSNDNYFPLLLSPYRSHRALLFRLARSLQLESTTVETSLLKALAIIIEGENKRGDWIADKGIDLSFATKRWQALIRVKQGDTSRIHRRYLEICVFSHLASDMKSGDVSVTGSEAFADYRQQLLPWSECKTMVPSYCERIGLPATAHEFVAELRGKLERTAQRVDDGYLGNHGELVINDQGEPTLKRVVARDIPQSALELEAAILPEDADT